MLINGMNNAITIVPTTTARKTHASAWQIRSCGESELRLVCA
jgi:hypothetical protein